MRIYKVTINAGAAVISLTTSGVDVSLIDTVTNSAGEADGSVTEIIGPMFDRTDGGLIFINSASSFGGVYVFKWIEGTGVIWTTPVAATFAPINGETIASSSIIKNGLFGWTDISENGILIDTTDGTVIQSGIDLIPLVVPDASNSGQQFFDSETQSVITVQSSSDRFIAQFFLGRATGLGESLGSIVADISDRVGLGVGDVNVSELTEIVRGYGVTRQMTARAAVQPLSTAFLFEGVETDDVVDFKKRGRDPIRTITENDMLVVAQDTHDVISETRTQEVELPERISITYMDIDTDYQQGTQSVKRIQSPDPTMRSSNEQTIPLAIVFTASEAEQIAEKLLFTAWNERTTYTFLLPWEHLDLDPADVIDLSITRNAVTTNIRTRLVKATVNLDLTVSAEGLNEDKITVESTATSDGALGVPIQEVAGPAETQLFLFDVPLLRDIDDGGKIAARLYYAMDGFRDNWPGGVLFRSPDAFTFTNTGLKSTLPVSHGIVNGLVPDTTTPFLTDDVTQINIILEEGALTSVTQTQFLNNASAGLFGSLTTGIFEVIAFRDVVLESDGSFTISTLMRGRRGTEVFTGDHVAFEKFFFLDPNDVQGYLEELGNLNISTFYKGVGFGQTPEAADTRAFVPIGRSQMPYAPALLDAVVDGSDNVDLTWVRRNRISGTFSNGTVPLTEDSELYEVDILDGPGGTVVRTIAGLVTPAAQYAVADITADLAVTTGTTTLDVAAKDKFSRSAGSFVADGFVVGQAVSSTLFTAGANNGTFTVVAVQATLLEVDTDTLVVETGTADEVIEAIREDDLTFVVYQISGQVTRGFPAETTITL